MCRFSHLAPTWRGVTRTVHDPQGLQSALCGPYVCRAACLCIEGSPTICCVYTIGYTLPPSMMMIIIIIMMNVLPDGMMMWVAWQ